MPLVDSGVWLYVPRVTFLGIGAQKGGRIFPKLEKKCLDPTANKYHKGKMKRTLRRVLKLLEIAEKQSGRTEKLRRDYRAAVCTSQLVVQNAVVIRGLRSAVCFSP